MYNLKTIMKKKTLLLLSLLLAFCMNAQTWNANENGLKTGLRTMGNFGYFFGHALEFGGTVGYQFNPYIFVGGSASYMYDIETNGFSSNTWAVPICADFRVDCKNRQFTPFLGVKVGYSVTGNVFDRMITSAEIGVRYHIKNRLAVNLGLAVLYGDAWSDSEYDDEDGLHEWEVGAFGLRMGFEF